jgi:type II secretory pathway component PulC
LKRVLQAVSVVLALISMLLVWRVVQVWRVSPPEFAEVVQVAAKPLPAPPARTAAAPTAVDAIVQGNLFETERGSVETAAGAEGSQDPLPPPTNVVLNGVFFQTTGRPMAIITDTSTGNRQLTLQEGDNVGDYQVGKITRDRVTLLGNGGQEFSLELAVSQGVGGAAVGAPPVRPAAVPPRAMPPQPATQAAQTAAQRAAAARRQAQARARTGQPGQPGQPGQERQEEPQQNEATQARLEALRRLREAASSRP